MFFKKRVPLLIVIASLMVLALIAAQCGAAPTPETIVETVVVEKEVEGETITVVETVVVEVVETVEVEKIVEVEAEPEEVECNVEAPAEKTRVNMIGWTYPIVDFYAEELEKCNDVDNLTVNTQLLDSGSAHDQIRLALSSGETSPYDIIMNDDAFVVELGNEGWLLPLDDLIEKYKDEYDLADIPDSVWDTGTIDGKIYAVPIEANTIHLFYRPDLLEKYNLEVPETYDDVIAACEVLKQEDSIDLPFTMNLHAGWAWRIEFHNFLKASGGQWLNEDSTPAFDSPEGVAAVEKMLEVVNACMGEEGLTFSIDDSEIGMETGALAMVNIWASRAANMDNPEKSEFVGGINFAPAPSVIEGGPHAGPAAVSYYSIPAKTQLDHDLVFRVIMEATDYDSQIGAAMLGIPTRKSILEVAESRYLSAAMETIANGAGNYGPDPAVALAETAIANWLPKVATGELSPQEALDAAAEEYISEATAQGYLQ
jgi:ABC-type glycerol-3-phosphate transport system substrate-binding protein